MIKDSRHERAETAELLSESEFAQLITEAREKRAFEALTAAIPYAQTLGIEMLEGEDLEFLLPKRATNIGNPLIPALHGGVIGGFLELSASLYLLMKLEVIHMPKIVDFSIDYLRAGLNKDSVATCTLTRQGKRVANISVTAWQENPHKMIATARAHFLIT